MATLSTSLLAVLLSLFVGAGVADPIIRRQEEDMAMHLSSSGKMARVSPHASSEELLRSGPARSESKDNDLCDDDYPLGVPDTNDCADKTNHKIIEQEKMCIEAAREAGATLDQKTFLVPRHNKDERPKGCFMAPCSHGNGICYFMNPIGDLPTAPKGTPICSRRKLKMGTENTNGVGTDCPAGYRVVMGEDECHEAVGCMGNSPGEPFRADILNAAEHDKYPEGCFKAAKTVEGAVVKGEVYYNAPVEGTGKPKNPVGTPICNVSQVIKCMGATGATCAATDGNMLGSGSSAAAHAAARAAAGAHVNATWNSTFNHTAAHAAGGL